MVKLIIL